MRRQLMVLFVVLWSTVAVPPVFAQQTTCEGEHQDVSLPLTDLGDQFYVRISETMTSTVTNQTGGLYPGGSNVRPPAHTAAGRAIARTVVPLDTTGQPDPVDGKITMISVGMSNTAAEFREFRLAALADPNLNPRLVLVNGATAGRTAEYWTDPYTDTWHLVNDRLALAGVTPAQVQVAWVKLTRTGGGNFPDKPQQLQTDLGDVARALRVRYPNIKLVYFSSRTRSYTYWNGLSPEPAAFETGFAVKWLLEQQLQGDLALNFDPAQGPVVSPWLSWGAYLWIDGLNPRSDGRVWPQTDLVPDCTHPSDSGEDKVAEQLLEFFKTDVTTRCWFLAGCWSVYLPQFAVPPPAAFGLAWGQGRGE